jgi:hypothetical protein
VAGSSPPAPSPSTERSQSTQSQQDFSPTSSPWVPPLASLHMRGAVTAIAPGCAASAAAQPTSRRRSTTRRAPVGCEDASRSFVLAKDGASCGLTIPGFNCGWPRRRCRSTARA